MRTEAPTLLQRSELQAVAWTAMLGSLAVFWDVALDWHPEHLVLGGVSGLGTVGATLSVLAFNLTDVRHPRGLVVVGGAGLAAVTLWALGPAMVLQQVATIAGLPAPGAPEHVADALVRSAGLTGVMTVVLGGMGALIARYGVLAPPREGQTGAVSAGSLTQGLRGAMVTVALCAGMMVWWTVELSQSSTALPAAVDAWMGGLLAFFGLIFGASGVVALWHGTLHALGRTIARSRAGVVAVAAVVAMAGLGWGISSQWGHAYAWWPLGLVTGCLLAAWSPWHWKVDHAAPSNGRDVGLIAGGATLPVVAATVPLMATWMLLLAPDAPSPALASSLALLALLPIQTGLVWMIVHRTGATTGSPHEAVDE